MRTNGSIRILDCGLIRNATSLPHSECLRRLAGGIRELVSTFKPEAAAIESAFVSRNVKTAMILSLARGAVITALAECSVPAFEYSPKSAKRAATGLGEADKSQVAAIMANLGGLDISQIPDDATDALALAYCHGNMVVRAGTAGLVKQPQPI